MRPYSPQMPMKNGNNWRGGRYVDFNGYVQFCIPNHPRASSKGTVAEHVVVVERAMGKYLPSTVHVHHVDGNPQNNAPSIVSALNAINVSIFATGK